MGSNDIDIDIHGYNMSVCVEYVSACMCICTHLFMCMHKHCPTLSSEVALQQFHPGSNEHTYSQNLCVYTFHSPLKAPGLHGQMAEFKIWDRERIGTFCCIKK